MQKIRGLVNTFTLSLLPANAAISVPPLPSDNTSSKIVHHLSYPTQPNKISSGSTRSFAVSITTTSHRSK